MPDIFLGPDFRFFCLLFAHNIVSINLSERQSAYRPDQAQNQGKQGFDCQAEKVGCRRRKSGDNGVC